MTSDELGGKINQKIAAQIDLEIERIKKEAKEVKDPKKHRWAKRVGIWMIAQIATITVVVTATLGILTYRDGLVEKKRDRFNSLVQRLIERRELDQYNTFVAMSTLGAIRDGYAKDGAYAFQVAFIAMPYVFLAKDHEDLRLIAARTLIDAIGQINDAEQHYRLNSTFLKRSEIFNQQPSDSTRLFTTYSAGIVCALVDSSYRNNLPQKGDREKCRQWAREGRLP